MGGSTRSERVYTHRKVQKLGAIFYVQPYKNTLDAQLNKWLLENSSIVYKGESGIIYKLSN